jgi:hypothetical protein
VANARLTDADAQIMRIAVGKFALAKIFSGQIGIVRFIKRAIEIPARTVIRDGADIGIMLKTAGPASVTNAMRNFWIALPVVILVKEWIWRKTGARTLEQIMLQGRLCRISSFRSCMMLVTTNASPQNGRSFTLIRRFIIIVFPPGQGPCIGRGM